MDQVDERKSSGQSGEGTIIHKSLLMNAVIIENA
jgi:hypothetical protein